MQSPPSELIGRIRINESRLSHLRERLLVTDNNSISEFKKISLDVRELNSELKGIKTDIFKVKEVLKDITKELENFARNQDVKILEKYINMWNPLNFITEKEVIKLIKENARSSKPNR